MCKLGWDEFGGLLHNAVGHFSVICRHKYYVFQNCLVAGMPLTGIMHDMSKFSYIEFMEGVKYYQGTKSPIIACKEAEGYSKGWLHHKGRNKHHYEYWQDNFDQGGKSLQIPFKYALELVCDYIAAGKAYAGDSFTYQREYEWWLNKLKKPLAMHKQTKLFITYMLKSMADKNTNRVLNKAYARKVYARAERECNK